MNGNKKWITNKAPKFEDCDEDGDVIVSYGGGNEFHCHWTSVMVGAHWKHSEAWKSPSHFPSKEGWITDRPPTKGDSDARGLILTESNGEPQYSPWDKAWKQPPWKHSPQWVPPSTVTENKSQCNKLGEMFSLCSELTETLDYWLKNSNLSDSDARDLVERAKVALGSIAVG